MHVRELIHLAAKLAVHAPSLISSGRHASGIGAQLYWTASRCRLDRWTRELRRHANCLQESSAASVNAWRHVTPLIEEILASELLTRVWMAISAAYDARHGETELQPVARSVLSGHLEIRSRVLAALLAAAPPAVREARRLNELRGKVERWTDLLLSHCAAMTNVSELCFDAERIREFVRDLDERGCSPSESISSQLMLSSIRGSFKSWLTSPSPNADLNEQIGQSVTTFLSPTHGCALGETSSWLTRIITAADEAQQMLDEILADA